MKRNREVVLITAATLTLFAAGCAKKKVASAPPPPPPPSTTQAPASQPAARNEQRAAATPQREEQQAVRPRMPDAATRARIDELLARIADAFFDYDKSNLRPDAIQALQADSTELRNILKDYPDYKLTIEGHCDERGSAEYNVALGDRRADAAKDYLTQVGIPGQQLSVISYGKEKPVCTESDEACWQKNRRIHIVAMATK
jgi:peptidoglycan-associated lipoprotein